MMNLSYGQGTFSSEHLPFQSISLCCSNNVKTQINTAFSLVLRKIVQFCGFLLGRCREWPEDSSLMGKSISLFRFQFLFFAFPPSLAVVAVFKLKSRFLLNCSLRKFLSIYEKWSYSLGKWLEISAFCPEIWRYETSNRYETFNRYSSRE